jgi:uncharacterized protein YdaU (DUF1376 family)
MADFPALPIWTDAYLADTRLLTTLQHGAYLLLLMEAWRRPNTVMSFWKLDQRTSLWSQKRLSTEKSYVQKSREKQRLNANARWNKDKTPSHRISQTDAPTPTPTPTPIRCSTDVEQGGGEPPPKADLAAAFELWNKMAIDHPSLPKAQHLTDTRKKRLQQRLIECGGIDGWQAALAKVSASAFCQGGNDRGWVADLDFMLQQSSFTRLMEGKYDNRPKLNGSNSASDNIRQFLDGDQ